MTTKDKEYFDEVARQLCGDFSAIQSIERFTKNSAVIGAYAEAHITSFARRFLQPIRVSTGTIISPTDFKTNKLPQIDLIAWDPNPLPAIMDEGNFALVPKNSVIGCLEIKRTDYSEGLDDIDKKSSSINQPNSNGFLGIVCVRENL